MLFGEDSRKSKLPPAIQPPSQEWECDQAARCNQQNQVRADAPDGFEVFPDDAAIFGSPAVTVALLHQQGHQAACLAQFGLQAGPLPVLQGMQPVDAMPYCQDREGQQDEELPERFGFHDGQSMVARVHDCILCHDQIEWNGYFIKFTIVCKLK